MIFSGGDEFEESKSQTLREMGDRTVETAGFKDSGCSFGSNLDPHFNPNLTLISLLINYNHKNPVQIFDFSCKYTNYVPCSNIFSYIAIFPLN